MKSAEQPVAIVAAFLPLACYLLLVAAAVYSWAVVGTWPSYGNPDPKDLPVRTVYTIAIIATLVGIASVVVLPVLELAFMAVRRAWRKQWRPHGRRIVAVYGIGALLWIVGVVRWRIDAGGLVNWIFD